MNSFLRISLCLLIISCAACGSIRTHRTLTSPAGSVLSASPGSTLFRLEKTGDLPNAFGGRDIFGGKVSKGFTEVKLIDCTESQVKLLVVDVNLQSDETTMDRYGKGNYRSESLTVNGGIDAGIPVTLNLENSKEYVFSGVTITFLNSSDSIVSYALSP